MLMEFTVDRVEARFFIYNRREFSLQLSACMLLKGSTTINLSIVILIAE
jgi:hypothetical protein